ALVASGDEDEMFDAGLLGLVVDVLDQRLVDDRQHFLRHGLGGGQEAGAEAGNRQHGLLQRLVGGQWPLLATGSVALAGWCGGVQQACHAPWPRARRQSRERLPYYSAGATCL